MGRTARSSHWEVPSGKESQEMSSRSSNIGLALRHSSYLHTLPFSSMAQWRQRKRKELLPTQVESKDIHSDLDKLLNAQTCQWYTELPSEIVWRSEVRIRFERNDAAESARANWYCLLFEILLLLPSLVLLPLILRSQRRWIRIIQRSRSTGVATATLSFLLLSREACQGRYLTV